MPSKGCTRTDTGSLVCLGQRETLGGLPMRPREDLPGDPGTQGAGRGAAARPAPRLPEERVISRWRSTASGSSLSLRRGHYRTLSSSRTSPTLWC